MRKLWILLANWAISPVWFVAGLFIYLIAGDVASGQAVCSGVADLVFTIVMLIVLTPIASISFYLHYPFHLLAYYAISGSLIYVGYRIWKKHILKESEVK
jgi:fucose 4-O-acetylase-like acetyltransferase